MEHPRDTGAPVTVRRLDHVAIPVDDMDTMLSFYTSIGFTIDDSMEPFMMSVCCGDMKLNLHYPQAWQSGEFDLRGPTAVPGCGDLCMVWDGTEADLETMLSAASVSVIEGPVQRVGGKDFGSASGASRYVRDPEGNLLEFIIYP